MKLVDLLKVVKGYEVVDVMDEYTNDLAVFEVGDVIGCNEDGYFVREENNTMMLDLLEKEVSYVFVAVIEPFGLPGLNVIVK